MRLKKKVAESWPRTFRDLMAKTRAEVRRSRFVSSVGVRASGRTEDEALEDARSELKSAVGWLESVAGEASGIDATIDFSTLEWALRDLENLVEALIDAGRPAQIKLRDVARLQREVDILESEATDEYKQWQRDKSRHDAEIIGLGRRVKEYAKKLKGIRI